MRDAAGTGKKWPCRAGNEKTYHIMAKYIIQRLPDGMLGDGERLFPKIVKRQVHGTEWLADGIEVATSFTKGDVQGLLSALSGRVWQALSMGDSVKLDGLGLFYPVLGLVGKEERGPWKDASGRTTAGRNVRLKSVGFRPEKRLLREVKRGMELVKVDSRAVDGAAPARTTMEERAAKARKYLAKNGYMHVGDYAGLNGLPYTTAYRELRKLDGAAGSGLVSRGAGSGKVYVLARE